MNYMQASKRIKLSLLLIISFYSFVQSQETNYFPEKPFKSLGIESYLSVLPNDYNNMSGISKLHLEFTYNISLLTNLSSRWQLGLQYNYIWTKYDKVLIDKFYIAGVIGRYNYSLNRKLRFYGETGLNLGNYCFCLHDVRLPDELPFKKEKMIFTNLGLGATLKIYRSLWLKVGGASYIWLNKDKKIYYGGFNIPTIGLILNVE